MRHFLALALCVPMLLCSAGIAVGQTNAGHVGISGNVSTLGTGVDAAFPVLDRSNVRVGFNVFNFNHDFDNDGITLAAQLKMRSVSVHFDWFPFAGGFHVSPGLMLYDGNRVEAAATVPAAKRFELGGENLISNPANPVTGNAKIAFEKVAPSILVGWGNLVPRGDRRWSIPVELGIVYSRAPTASLTLGGSACAQNGTNCRSIATDPTLQADVRKQQEQLTDDLSFFKILPVFSFGFSYKF